MNECQRFSKQARASGLRVLVVGETAYTPLGAFCFDPSCRIPRMRSMLAFTALEALQQATLWMIEGERPKYLRSPK